MAATLSSAATECGSSRLFFGDGYLWMDILAVVPQLTDWCLVSADVPVEIDNFTTFLRLMRILKLLRHYTDWRVLTIALRKSCRPVLIPAFAMLLTILILSGALWLAEGHDTMDDPSSGDDGPHKDKFVNAFETMWTIFFLMTTLGFSGYVGSGSTTGRLIIAGAIVAGILFTTMPITLIGEAFGDAWANKQVLEIEVRPASRDAIRPPLPPTLSPLPSAPPSPPPPHRQPQPAPSPHPPPLSHPIPPHPSLSHPLFPPSVPTPIP